MVKFPFESHGYARVVFKDRSRFAPFIFSSLFHSHFRGSVAAALTKMTSRAAPEEAGAPVKGVARWYASYREFYLQDASALQESIDSFMNEYDRRKKRERKAADELATVQDEDGWTVVVRRGKKKASQDARGGAATVGTATASKADLLARKEKEKDRLIDNFYRYQKQEEKRQRLDELRRKFELDKRRIARAKGLTSTRKFKPT